MFTNYKYYTDNKSTVIAVSTYAGKTVRGVAKCNIEDQFDLEKGKQLAAARCNLKIAKKRYKRSRNKYYNNMNALKKANENFYNTCDYYKNSCTALKQAEEEVNNLISMY